MSTPTTNDVAARVAGSTAGWISARHVRHFVARGEAAGFAMDEILHGAGLTRPSLLDADGLVPLTAIEHMLAAIARQQSDPLIGLGLAGDVQPATLGALGYIAQACATFSDVLDAVVRYSGLLSNIGRITVIPEPGSVRMCWECAAGGALFRRNATEYVLGLFAVMLRLLLTDNREVVRSVTFAHAAPDDPEVTRRYPVFFRCPVYFDREVSSVTIPASLLNLRLRHGDAFMKEMLEQHAANLLQQRNQQSSLVDETGHLIHAMLVDGVPGKEAVAAQLGMSGRTLHRKLQELGTSYQRVLDRVRLDIARERLRATGDSMEEIAQRLGFASRQAFLRWFKDSVGQTPGEYRKEHQ